MIGMTDEEIAEIESVWAAATPGSWEVYDRGSSVRTADECPVVYEDSETGRPHAADAAAIAAAPGHVASLVAEVKRLRALEVDALTRVGIARLAVWQLDQLARHPSTPEQRAEWGAWCAKADAAIGGVPAAQNHFGIWFARELGEQWTAEVARLGSKPLGPTVGGMLGADPVPDNSINLLREREPKRIEDWKNFGMSSIPPLVPGRYWATAREGSGSGDATVKLHLVEVRVDLDGALRAYTGDSDDGGHVRELAHFRMWSGGGEP